MSNGDPVPADSYLGDDGALQDGWLDALPEDTFEKDDTGVQIKGNLADHKTLGSFVKSHLSQAKLVGSAIQPLKKDATPEERAEFYQKFGCPKTVAEYELPKPTDLPEGMEYKQDLADAIAAIALNEGVSKSAMQKLAASFNQWQIENFKAEKTGQEAAIAKTFDEGEAALKVEWGTDYDKNIEITNKLTTEIPELMDIVKLVFDTTGKGNHPAVHKALFAAAKKILSDTVITGRPAKGKTTKAGQLDYSTVVGRD